MTSNIDLASDPVFKDLEDMIYECLYEQEIIDISECKYFEKCKVCKAYLLLVDLYSKHENKS